MRLTNTTNIPDERIREIIRKVRPSGISNFDINIKNGSCRFGGMSYANGCAYHCNMNPLVTVRIGRESQFPYRTKAIHGYLPALMLSREEALTHVIAHELRHLWQAKHPKGWRVWGSKGKYSERDADAFAIRKVRELRKA